MSIYQEVLNDEQAVTRATNSRLMSANPAWVELLIGDSLLVKLFVKIYQSFLIDYVPTLTHLKSKEALSQG